jgi:hypothetical protein
LGVGVGSWIGSWSWELDWELELTWKFFVIEKEGLLRGKLIVALNKALAQGPWTDSSDKAHNVPTHRLRIRLAAT